MIDSRPSKQYCNLKQLLMSEGNAEVPERNAEVPYSSEGLTFADFSGPEGGGGGIARGSDELDLAVDETRFDSGSGERKDSDISSMNTPAKQSRKFSMHPRIHCVLCMVMCMLSWLTTKLI